MSKTSATVIELATPRTHGPVGDPDTNRNLSKVGRDPTIHVICPKAILKKPHQPRIQKLRISRYNAAIAERCSAGRPVNKLSTSRRV